MRRIDIWCTDRGKGENMLCRVVDLRHKEVINSQNGVRIGFVDDVEVDTCTSQVKSVIVYGKPRLFGILGRNEDIIIPWQDIELIGEDTILVCNNIKISQKKTKKLKYFS